MQSKTITLKNKLGLHARASIKVVDTASRFSSCIQLTYKTKTIDAKDILDVMSLGAACGAHLTVKTNGEDELAAIQAIIGLIENKFGESE